MSLLHAYFHLRNQQAFQRVLDGNRGERHGSTATTGAVSSSSGRSWSKPSPLSVVYAQQQHDINARDWLGRTVLHLAAASTEVSGLEYMRLLLAQPGINVNLADSESHWTALHRALYQGNIASAMLLLKAEADPLLKDFEGYTAFDLYNSTMRTTKPSVDGPMELFTWGINRNAALGHGDGDDRLYPDQVIVPPGTGGGEVKSCAYFPKIAVHQVAMSKLHTVIVTSEPQNNLRFCGFGSGGRLGVIRNTQYGLISFPQLSYKIITVAVGQDHTLAVTSSGEVLSWGLNRFSQLGYMLEKIDEQIQATPKKIPSLKRAIVKGVAACRTASACWTRDELWTWGTNHGQLGYDVSAQPTQVLPRKVTKITQPVIQVAMTDDAMVCLLETRDVVCIWNDRHSKIYFPTHTFPAEYKFVHAVKEVPIVKVTCCDQTFAAISSSGELFTFEIPESSNHGQSKPGIKPQRVWALRKQFSGVHDVALGMDGSLIVCTQTGHVFVRTRNAKAGHTTAAKAFRFQRVPNLQRTVGVCSNNTGSFGALRREYRTESITLSPRPIAMDIASSRPFLPLAAVRTDERRKLSKYIKIDIAEEGDDSQIYNDIQELIYIHNLLFNEKEPAPTNDFSRSGPRHEGDVLIRSSSGKCFPVHKVILAARSAVLANVLDNNTAQAYDATNNISLRAKRGSGPVQLILSGVHDVSLLIILTYVYTDNLPCLWDPRVSAALNARSISLRIKPDLVKSELGALSRFLDMPQLVEVIQASGKVLPRACLTEQLEELYNISQTDGQNGYPPRRPSIASDVILRLADRDIYCHSLILRSRSDLFAAFFDTPQWTEKRRNASGVVSVNLQHLPWNVMQYVLQYLLYGREDDLFSNLCQVESTEVVMELLTEVMAAANELLLERLVLLSGSALLEHLDSNTACFILAEASHLNALETVRRSQDFIAANLEQFLSNSMLEPLSPILIKSLTEYVRAEQQAKSPVMRSNRLNIAAMNRQETWLAMQDIPVPIIPIHRTTNLRESPKVVPITPKKVRRKSSMGSPILEATQRTDDDVFIMDGDVATSSSQLEIVDNIPQLDLDGSKGSPAWQTPSFTPRFDMKTIMAETEISSDNLATRELHANAGWDRLSQRERRKKQISPMLSPATSFPPTGEFRPPTGSPWKIKNQLSTMSQFKPANLSYLNNASYPPPISSQSESRQGSAKGSFPNKSMPKQSQPLMSGQDLGPIIYPSRLTPSTSSELGHRNGISKTAWTSKPYQMDVGDQPNKSTFAAIQKQQHNESLPVSKVKQSLREIQEEEAARQAEIDFLRWWSAEEARTMSEERQNISNTLGETQRTISSKKNDPLKSARRSRPPKGMSNSGKNAVAASPPTL